MTSSTYLIFQLHVLCQFSIMLYFIYYGIILFLPEQGFLCVWWKFFKLFPFLSKGGFHVYEVGWSSKILCPNSYLSPSESKESYKCTDLRFEILSAKYYLCLFVIKTTHGSGLQFQFPSCLFLNLVCVQSEIHTMEHGHILWR